MTMTRLIAETDQLLARGRLRDAERILERYLKTNPNDVDALNRLGLAKAQLGQWAAAAGAWERVVNLVPTDTNASTNLGMVLRLQGRLEEALAPLTRAATQAPSALTINNLGLVKLDLQQFAEAKAHFLTALSLESHYPEALNNLGTVLIKLGQFEEAIPPLSTAITLRPDYAKALTNRAAAYLELGHNEKAHQDLVRSFAIDPQQDFLAGLVLHTEMQLCARTHFIELQRHIIEGLRSKKKVAAGFALVAAIEDPHLLRTAAEVWAADQTPEAAMPLQAYSSVSERVRIGYFSADFHNHATAHLIAGLIEAHDRTRYEISGYSFGPDRQDEMRSRLVRAFDQFYEVSALSDAALAQLAREHAIDIAIDLKGYTQSSRPGIFAHRAAPVQVNYLGYPGTMGATFIDYIIADQYLVPLGAESAFSEKIIRLPESYQVNDAARPRPLHTPSRNELGLPEHAFVFCSFNNNYKITPEVFDTWMAILRARDNSVLWLLQDNASAAANLRQTAKELGVDPTRLIFAPRVAVADHLARHRAANLFLDTWPCNAHTTASDALWMGLPIVTLSQRSFASRVAGSLLTAVGLAQQICSDRESYIRLALEISENERLLQSLREQLLTNPESLPLFNTRRFCRHFEQAVSYAVDLSRRGEPSRHFSVDSNSEVF